MSKKILITGGCGFIGSNLVPALMANGYSPKVFDNLSKGDAANVDADAVEIIIGDVCDADQISAAVAGVDVVVHLAAYGSVVASVTDPLPNYENNVLGTFNVLQACRERGVQRMVFASTGGAIMGNTPPPVTEVSLPKPISPYGASKLCGEAYCNAFSSSFGLETVILRFANVYGPVSAHKIGAVTAFIKNLLNDRPIEIYGDGSATRDFLHVEALCAGIVSALDYSCPTSDIFHLASGVETSVSELATALCRIAGKPQHEIRYLDKRPGEVERSFARFDKAKQALDFDPMFDLDTGLEKTYRWFQDRFA